MGVSFLEEYPDSPATQKYMEIVESASQYLSPLFPLWSFLDDLTDSSVS
jgi:hypothetical protein